MANCARITAKDILATNGVVHVVDKVSYEGYLIADNLDNFDDQMIQPATNSLGQILTDDFGFAKFSAALKASGGDDSN